MKVRRSVAAAVAVGALVVMSTGPARAQASGEDPETAWSGGTRKARVDAGRIWAMHAIDSRFRGANALDAADVNGDGLDDFVTNYEFDQRYVISFMPTDPSARTQPWPTMTFLCPTAVPERGCDTESATLADFDGDGNLDIVGPQGGHPDLIFDGDEPGIRVIWGPGRDRVADPSAWTDAGRFPQTIGLGHFLDAEPFDMNADGATDLVFGGRRYFRNDSPGGIRWLEAPADPSRRRNLDTWTLHSIDPETVGGHGFVLVDLTGDGAPEVVDATADFDTPAEEQAVVWYENPGPAAVGSTERWTKSELVRDDDFYGKPQIAVGDMNGDGRDDLVTQTQHEYLVFTRARGADVAFDLVRIPKPSVIEGPTRPIVITDVDGNGRPDIVAGMTHEGGVLPASRASVYWLSFAGQRLRADAMTVHVIKWSQGRTMSASFLGEKWDQFRVRDVNGDGAPDVVANGEEWFQQPDGETVVWSSRGPGGEAAAVVWFENPTGTKAPECRASAGSGTSGSCVMEAESFTNLGDGTWAERNQVGGASAGRYLQAFNGMNPRFCRLRPAETPADCPQRPDGALLARDSAGAEYRMRFDAPGAKDVWVRLLTPAQFGNRLGATASDSVLVSIGGAKAQTVGDADVAPDTWTWVKAATAVRVGRGAQTLTLRVRERGTAVDQIALVPAGSGAPS